MRRFRDFAIAIDEVKREMEEMSIRVHPRRWQAIDVSKNPAAEMHELTFYSFRAPMSDNLDAMREQIKPNLPWADDHFAERVCGYPINPGVQWRNWPYSHSADRHRKGGQFNHNYMERYWPRQAGLFDPHPTETSAEWVHMNNSPLRGIRHDYGDLNGVVRLLAKEPDTRQAYLPVWFPEDTGDSHDGRKPCTLGYHFLVRDDRLHVVYYIRSCDFLRHFRDDIYLTARLAVWIRDQVDAQADAACLPISKWRLGDLIMHISSLHMFRNDYLQMFGHG